MGGQPSTAAASSGAPDIIHAPRPRIATPAIAWTIAATYHFYQCLLRSAPSVMMPQLSDIFALTVPGIASIVGFFYWGYSPFSLVAGASIDRQGPRRVMPLAAALAGIGALLFATGNREAASIGRFLQGAAGVFAPVGAIYIACKYFPHSESATLIGATQMFGMAGSATGQVAVGWLIGQGFRSEMFWVIIGFVGLALSVLLLILLPNERPGEKDVVGWKSTLDAFYVLFKNPQSILCGLISGLLFIPTTIFDMLWGVHYLQEAHGFEFASAVMRSATVPVGWIIGCPLAGFISDRLERRKPVIVGGAALLLICLSWILFGKTGVLPPYTVGLLAGIASGAAMLPYTIVNEANPPEMGGTATGVINFINFTFSASLGPIFAWILENVSHGNPQRTSAHYQLAFAPLLLGVVAAVMLTLCLKETGPGVQMNSSAKLDRSRAK